MVSTNYHWFITSTMGWIPSKSLFERLVTEAPEIIVVCKVPQNDTKVLTAKINSL